MLKVPHSKLQDVLSGYIAIYGTNKNEIDAVKNGFLCLWGKKHEKEQFPSTILAETLKCLQHLTYSMHFNFNCISIKG